MSFDFILKDMRLFRNALRILHYKRGNRPVVILDIGSSSVAAAVVSFSDNVPHIECCVRKYVPFQDQVDENRFAPLLGEVLESVIQTIHKEGLCVSDTFLVPREIVCVLSSPWHDTETLTASFEQQKPFRVTEKVMDNLIAQIESQRGSTEGSTIIEDKIIHSALNGYTTQSPLGKTASRISVTFLRSTATTAIHNKVTEVVEKSFGGDIPIEFRSFTLASFSVVRDLFGDVKDCMLVDVTGEVTGMYVVRESVLGDTLSFPYGQNTIIRHITQKRGGVPEDTHSQIKLYFSNKEGPMSDYLIEEEKQWVEMFGKSCGELATESEPLPERVFLVTSAEFEKWFTEMIGRVDFSQFTATRDVFKVEPLMSAKVSDLCKYKEGVPRDSFISTAALFYNKEYNNPHAR